MGGWRRERSGLSQPFEASEASVPPSQTPNLCSQEMKSEAARLEAREPHVSHPCLRPSLACLQDLLKVDEGDSPQPHCLHQPLKL